MAANSQFAMAVHILTMLARSGEENVKSECIAGSVNTNAVVIRRLLGQLSSANLVVSQTGAFGGTRLARPPEKISLCEIYKAFAGDCSSSKSPNQDCPSAKISNLSLQSAKEIDNLGRENFEYTPGDDREDRIGLRLKFF